MYTIVERKKLQLEEIIELFKTKNKNLSKTEISLVHSLEEIGKFIKASKNSRVKNKKSKKNESKK